MASLVRPGASSVISVLFGDDCVPSWRQNKEIRDHCLVVILIFSSADESGKHCSITVHSTVVVCLRRIRGNLIENRARALQYSTIHALVHPCTMFAPEPSCIMASFFCLHKQLRGGTMTPCFTARRPRRDARTHHKLAPLGRLPVPVLVPYHLWYVNAFSCFYTTCHCTHYCSTSTSTTDIGGSTVDSRHRTSGLHHNTYFSLGIIAIQFRW